jgi:uncharacterized protein (DUF849 family)
MGAHGHGACLRFLTMDHAQVIAALKAELEQKESRINGLRSELQEKERELLELHQRLDIRNLSLERLQAQFTVAAEAVTKLLAERERLRTSRWANLGAFFGFLPKLEDDLK